MARISPRQPSPAPRKRRKIKFTRPSLPEPSSDDIDNILEAGEICSDQRRLVEDGLVEIRENYLHTLDTLGFYASDKKITKDLTRIFKRAAALAEALESSEAVIHVLDEHHMLAAVERLGELDWDAHQANASAFDNDVAAVPRIQAVTRAALKRQDELAKSHPDRLAKNTAEKPGIRVLVRDVLTLWSETLGRSDKGKDGKALIGFGMTIFELFLGSGVTEEKVQYHLREERRRREQLDAQTARSPKVKKK